MERKHKRAANKAELESESKTVKKAKSVNNEQNDGWKPKNLASFIDHTNLNQKATWKDIKTLCQEARYYGFATVCVNPCWIPEVVKELKGSGVKVCCVVGFPLGANLPSTKALETKEVIAAGAEEVDMVLNISKLKDHDYDYVLKDIKGVVEASECKALVKVILETCLLTNEEIIKACQLSEQAGASFVKTSTGFSKNWLPSKKSSGAVTHEVELMRMSINSNIRVKASGGIHNLKEALAMIKAGASRLGTSSSIKIINE